MNGEKNGNIIFTESKSSIKFWRLQDGSPRWEIKVYHQDPFQIISTIKVLDANMSNTFIPEQVVPGKEE